VVANRRYAPVRTMRNDFDITKGSKMRKVKKEDTLAFCIEKSITRKIISMNLYCVLCLRKCSTYIYRQDGNRNLPMHVRGRDVGLNVGDGIYSIEYLFQHLLEVFQKPVFLQWLMWKMIATLLVMLSLLL
jgi:hypothetical protein